MAVQVSAAIVLLFAAILTVGSGATARADADTSAAELERALEEARASKRLGLEAAALNDLGNLLAAQGEVERALDTFGQAYQRGSAAGRHEIAAAAAINAARLQIRRSDTAAADQRLRAAEAALARQEAPSTMQLLALGRQYAALGQRAEAYAAYDRARTVAERRGEMRLQSFALGYLGQLYSEAGRRAEALDLTRRALFLAQSANAPEVLFHWQRQSGRLLAAEGRIDEAIQAYRGAVRTLAPIRPDLLRAAAGDGGAGLRATVEPVYLELADLLLRRAAAVPETAAKQDDMRTARSVVEQFRAAELEDYFRDQCVAELQARVRPIDRLDRGTAAVYPILLPERVVLLLSLPDGLVQTTLQVTPAELTQDVRALRRLLEKRTTRQFLPHAQRVYDLLIRPIEPRLTRAGIDTLVFIPAGPLRTIPLGALHDGEDFLIDRFAVATTPGLDLLDPRPLAETELSLLLNGLTEPVQGFPPLPYVETELAAVAELYGGRVLLDQQFVEPEVRESLARTPFSVIHIASHGEFAGDSDNSFLLTYDGRLDMDELERFIKLSQFRDEPVELLTLSACRTAAGDDRAALGLAGIAVKAGARSALATLWFVNDESSSLLVTEFYRQLGARPTPTKAKALQAAQQATKADPRWWHPAHWAPFLIIGNWL